MAESRTKTHRKQAPIDGCCCMFGGWQPHHKALVCRVLKHQLRHLKDRLGAPWLRILMGQRHVYHGELLHATAVTRAMLQTRGFYGVGVVVQPAATHTDCMLVGRLRPRRRTPGKLLPRQIANGLVAEFAEFFAHWRRKERSVGEVSSLYPMPFAWIEGGRQFLGRAHYRDDGWPIFE